MKAIMISIRPKYVADILNGRKTIEIRKSIPKCDLPIEVYIYCTKDQNEELWWYDGTEDFRLYKKGIANEEDSGWHLQNGKVVAKFTLNKVEEISCEMLSNGIGYDIFYYTETLNDMREKTCLDTQDFRNYLGAKPNGETVGYAWHIDNLVIFDKPKELSEFHKVGYEKVRYKTMRSSEAQQYKITKAPQSWQFIEVDENE